MKSSISCGVFSFFLGNSFSYYLHMMLWITLYVMNFFLTLGANVTWLLLCIGSTFINTNKLTFECPI